MIEQTRDIPTAAGQTDTLLCYPERGGPYPAVCVLMEAHGIREELGHMARRLATVGDDVLLPNLDDRERGQRSCHSCTARVEEPGDEYLAYWTTEPRVLITVTPERIATRAPRRR
jgi:dienelactone hydrolase